MDVIADGIEWDETQATQTRKQGKQEATRNGCNDLQRNDN